MAYDLVAKLRLKDDGFSSRISKAIKHTERFRKANEKLGDGMNRLVSRVSRSDGVMRTFRAGLGTTRTVARKTASAVGSMRMQFVGLAAALGGAVAAKNIFDKTIGAAAQFEQSEVLIQAMFDDDGKAQKFIKDMEELAINSPILNSQDILGSAKSFVSATKDVGQLNRIYRIVEKLTTLDPAQGVEGAALALKELFSGDSLSMVSRFEMDRSAMNEIKELDLPEQIEEMEKLIDSMGITQETIDAVGGTTLGIWNQIKERSDVVMRTMGQPALAKIRNFLEDVNTQMENGDSSGFIKYGQNVLTALTDGFINGSTLLFEEVNAIINDPKFISAEGVGGKAKVVLNRFYEGLKNWLDSGGKEKIQSFTDSFVSYIVTGIQNNTDELIKITSDLGVQLGGSILKGMTSALSESWLGSGLLGVGGQVVNKVFFDKNDEKPQGSYASGLSYVPKDMNVRVHKGERILTPEENREYKKDSSKPFEIKIETMNVRKESDIDSIAYALARKINEAGGLGA